MKWEKSPDRSRWSAKFGRYQLRIDRVNGNGAYPYEWSVFPIERDQDGVLRSLYAGSEKTLSDAKAQSAGMTATAS